MWENEKMLMTSILSFSHNVFKIFISLSRQNSGLYGKGLFFFFYLNFHIGIEEQVRNIQAKKQALNNHDAPPEKSRVGLGAGGHYDTDIYSSTNNRFEGYHTYIAAEDAEVRSSTIYLWTKIKTCLNCGKRRKYWLPTFSLFPQ